MLLSGYLPPRQSASACFSFFLQSIPTANTAYTHAPLRGGAPAAGGAAAPSRCPTARCTGRARCRAGPSAGRRAPAIRPGSHSTRTCGPALPGPCAARSHVGQPALARRLSDTGSRAGLERSNKPEPGAGRRWGQRRGSRCGLRGDAGRRRCGRVAVPCGYRAVITAPGGVPAFKTRLGDGKPRVCSGGAGDLPKGVPSSRKWHGLGWPSHAPVSHTLLMTRRSRQ